MASERIECTRCGSLLAKTQFYKSNSDLHKYSQKISICKECLNDLYEKYKKELKSDIKALYKLTMQLDIFFDEKLFETSKDKHIESNMSLPIYYFSKIGLSQYKGKTFGDSSMLDIWSKGKVEIKIEDKKDEKNKVTKEMIQRWGKDRDIEDYIYLEDKYNELISVYDHRMPTQRWSYETIVKTKLESEKALEREDYAMYDKLTDRVQKLQSDSNIKPLQHNSDREDNIKTVGMMAKIIEENEPINESIFEDVDELERKIDRQFVKNMMKVLGVGKNEN